MSANTFTLTCIGADNAALSTLHAWFESAIGAEFERWPTALQPMFEEWDRPFVLSASLRGETLRCKIDTSAHDQIEKDQLLGLHAAGAEYIRVHINYGQVGETETQHFKAGKPMSAKAFPQPTLSEGEQLYELVLESKDGALVKAIKAGASSKAVVDGVPIFVHALRAGMEKSIRALYDAGVDMSACLPWAAELAPKIHGYGGAKSETMLRALLSAHGAKAGALWRSRDVIRAVCHHPNLLQWLMAQPGVDPDAMLISDEEPYEELGSLLFNSVAVFEDKQEVLDLLLAHGARSIAPAMMSDQRRIDRMYWNERDAETPAQLAAAGVDLEIPVWDDYPALRCAVRNFSSGLSYQKMAVELLEFGASAAFWMEPKAFQREVLAGLFDGESFRICMHNPDEAFDAERDGPQIVAIFSHLLERGLDPNLMVSLDIIPMKGELQNGRSLRYRGTLLCAVSCLLCSRWSALRILCMPLVELLLRHGASPHGPAERVRGPWQEGYVEIHLPRGWTPTMEHFLETGTLLEHLQQQQAQAPDAVDAAVIAALLAHA